MRIATPRRDMILVMSRSVAPGTWAGAVTTAGVSVGLVGHNVLATLGLGAILRTSEWLFVALKLLGGGPRRAGRAARVRAALRAAAGHCGEEVAWATPKQAEHPFRETDERRISLD